MTSMLSVSAAHVAPWDDPRCSGCLMRCDFGGVEVRLCGDDSEANEESDNEAVMSSTSVPPVLTRIVLLLLPRSKLSFCVRG